MPPLENLKYIIIGVDLAISQKETADFTAMICLFVFKVGKGLQVYVSSQIVNKRLNLYQTGVTAKQLQYSVANGHSVRFVVEDVGYQMAALEHLKQEGLNVEAVTVHGQDKYTRLSMTTTYFEQGKIFFPREGATELIRQLTGFPSEGHDDLVDAFVYGILKVQEEENRPPFEFFSIGGASDYRRSRNIMDFDDDDDFY
jgi:predicted phage terminase large subunit-like protein